ncbi:unnamed protein product [Protopolystoma xenopodis]|uniref:Uncharacterized protein n=1 Tax=Protopolystoma xenopodis TaxID=117903 RepID=A0A3S5CH29_9PLAT|nr:unnamed protein product [Protopolystoma xenopodis]
MQAQSLIANLHFLQPLVCLDAASELILDLIHVACPDLYASSRSRRVVARLPGLLAWLYYFHDLLMAKYSLYWFSILERHAPNIVEAKNFISTENPDLVTK